MPYFRGGAVCHSVIEAHPKCSALAGTFGSVRKGRTPHGMTQVHKLQVYDGHIYAGTWPEGSVLRYEGGDQWTDCGQLGVATQQYQINEVNDLTVYNGKLHAGVLPRAEVYRFEYASGCLLSPDRVGADDSQMDLLLREQIKEALTG